ncbi:MAG TPA: NrfD/PsrC family molybdoenzyme membrane anchor subunit, partial [Polyangia bacterium]
MARDGESARTIWVDPAHTLASVSDRVADLTLRFPRPWLWLALFGFFLCGAGVMLLAITATLYAGVGLWGVNIPVAWGYAITNFVWWIGIGHAGTLISAILLLLRQRWRNSINRFAEAMTLFAVMQAGIFPLMHLGRPQRFFYLLPYPDTMNIWPQWRSPLTWDVVAVATYFTVSLLFWYTGLLPDLATLRQRARRTWVKRLAGIGSLGWRNSARHWQRYQMLYLLLGGLATPLVVSVHSIVSLDFATAILPGWHSTIFPPYFVAGAIYSGFAMVLTIAIPMRALLKLDDIIKVGHLEASAKVMLAAGLVVAYGYLFETFTDWFSADAFEVGGLRQRVLGPYAWIFWTVMFFNVLVGQALWVPRVRRSPVLLLLVALGVQLGMWLERLMIVVTSLYRDFMPSSWGFYVPTRWDWMLFLGTIGFFTTLMLLFIRFVPISSIAELRELVHRQREEGVAPPAPLPPPAPPRLDGFPPANGGRGL